MIRYPAIFEIDPDTKQVIVELPDIPGCISIGADQDEALAMGLDAALTWITGAMGNQERIPGPSQPLPGQESVEIPPMAEMKIYLYLAMLDQGVSQVRLARRLHTDPKVIRKLLNLWHKSEWDHLEMALEALGYQTRVTVAPSDLYPAFRGGRAKEHLVA